MRAPLVVFVVLAGCTGPTDDGSHEDSTLASADGTVSCTRSILVDESIRPVAGAHIAIDEIDWVTLTDDDGTYTYEGVPPGNFTVKAHWKDSNGDWRESQWHVDLRTCASFLQSKATMSK